MSRQDLNAKVFKSKHGSVAPVTNVRRGGKSASGAKRLAGRVLGSARVRSEVSAKADKELAAHKRLAKFHEEASKVSGGAAKIGHEVRALYHGICAVHVEDTCKPISDDDKRNYWVQCRVTIEDGRYKLNELAPMGRTADNDYVYRSKKRK